jgi:hypothetical protein
MRKRRSSPLIGPGAKQFSLTKLDVAEAHIKTAVRLFFEDGHPVSIYSLANAAREIVSVIAEKKGVKTVVDDIAAKRGSTAKETIAEGARIANWLKHADRDPTGKLEFKETDVDAMLRLACHDFGRVAGGMPIEAQIYEVWVTCLAFPKISDASLSLQPLLRKAIKYFPGLRSASRADQKRIGNEVLQECLSDPCVYRKPHPVMISDLTGKIPCS